MRVPEQRHSILDQREWSLVILIVLVTLVVSWVDSGFLAAGNLKDILVRCAPTAIVCCGVMLVIVTGEIDISVGSLMALLAAIMGKLMSVDHAQLPWGLAAVLTLLAGACVGTVTGALVAWGSVPSIIVTLGLLTSFRGLSTLLMGGENIAGLPPSLTELAKQGPGGVPLGVWVALAVIGVQYVLIRHTALGRRLFAVGSSQYASVMTGLSTRRLKLFAFAYTGFLTALATLVEVPRLPMIEAGIGREFELLVVTCVVVGGVSIAGGRGTLWGVLLAVLLMTMIRPVLTFLELGEAGEKWTKAIQGAFILTAVVSDSLFRRRSRTEAEK
jgi:ribose/xylose/arabinose/galactoside ABC-type transport system permease subunit